MTIGAPIEIYRRRRRVEFIGGGGVPAAAPTSACEFATSHDCGHSEDVFLVCREGENLFSLGHFRKMNINVEISDS